MRLETATQEDMEYVKELYIDAFPSEERKPFFFMKQQTKKGKCEILIIQEEKKNLGLVMLIPFRDILLIDYLAIDKSAQGNGVGSSALAMLRERYPGKRILIEIEELDEAAENAKQRESRKKFYLRNGFVECNEKVGVAGCRFELLGMPEKVTYEEYVAVLDHIFGWLLPLFIHPRRIFS